MCYGVGAVLLFYTIISAQSGMSLRHENEQLAAEAKLLEKRVLEGYKYHAELRNSMARTD